jgi:antitoxin (DNA-binding transcriptional repressor) of toxin-antitoxin stability system
LTSNRICIRMVERNAKPRNWKGTWVVAYFAKLGHYRNLTMWHIMCHIKLMPSVNFRQLRDTRRLETWLQAGKTVELRKRNKLIARIVPAKPSTAPAKWPDFEARAKEILGDRVLPNVVLEDRGRY